MEEFNIYDLYLNQVKQDDIYNSKEYKYLKDNNIDTAEIEGIDKDPDAGEIVFDKDEKISDEDNQIFFKDISDFVFKEIPKDFLVSIIRGGTNGFQFVNNLAGAAGINPDDTREVLNQKFEKIKTDLDNAQEDSPLVSKLMSAASQDAMYTYPIYKKLKKAGVPMAWRMPTAFALGGALAFDKKNSLFVASNSMRNLKAFIGIAEDTPIEEMYDKTVQAIEFGAFGKAFDSLLGVAKSFKTMDKDRIKQGAIAAGGASAATVVADEIVEQSLETDDQSAIPGTVNEYGFEKTAGLNNLAVQFLKKSGTKVQDLKKIPGGTGRSVFALDDDKVIKIAKMQRGIRENMNEGPDYMIDSWRPKVFEQGDDFVVVENVARADAQTRSFLKPLQKFNQIDFDNKTSELQDAMEALGLEDFMNYDLAWRDFTAARNWGKTKDGRIVLLDGGALDLSTLSKEVPDYVNKDWQEIISGRRKEGMGKFVIVAGAGGQGYRILDNNRNNTISKITEN